jgi:hypothetical protein
MQRVSTICSALILLAAATAAHAQDDAVDPAALHDRVAALTAPPLAGREAGTSGEAAAGDSLRTWLAAIGLRPAFAGQWSQPFALRGDSLGGRQSSNVAGVVPGRGALASRWIVLGAHLDHLGLTGDSAAAAGTYYPGANDNAVGVAALVAAAAQLAAAKDAGDRRGVLVVGFAAEEVGLQGSAWLCEHLPVAHDSVEAMINLDAIGVLTDGRLHVGGVGTSPPLAALVNDAAGDLPLTTSRTGWSGGDHVSFLLAKIPSVALFGGPYPEFNTTGDSLGVIHFDDLARVSAFAARLTDGLRRYPDRLPYDAVAPAMTADEGGDGNRDAWFGTVPAFGSDTPGYTIGQVVAGGPAARAGLRDGDLLESLGGEPVTDLGTFTRALRAHAPGDPVEVVVRRDGRSLSFTIVVGSRQDRR